MNIKTIQQWLPLIGGGLFLSWTGFLVLFSLLTSPEKPEQPAPPAQTPQPHAPPSPGCTPMPGGVLICDDATKPAEKAL